MTTQIFTRQERTTKPITRLESVSQLEKGMHIGLGNGETAIYEGQFLGSFHMFHKLRIETSETDFRLGYMITIAVKRAKIKNGNLVDTSGNYSRSGIRAHPGRKYNG